MSDDEFIEGQEIAELLELTPQRVSAMTQQGILMQDGKGRYRLRDSMHRICRWYRERLGEGKSKAALAKQRTVELQAQILEETLKKTRRESIDVRDVDRAWGFVVMHARSKLMRLPNKLATQIPYLKDVAAIEAHLQGGMDEALAELARPVEYQAEESEEE